MTRRSYSGSENPNWRDAGKNICIQCNADFQSYAKNRKYCSRACYTDNRRERLIPKQKPLLFGNKKVPILCPFCKVEMSTNPKVKTCGSLDCRRKYAKKKGTIVCRSCCKCGAEFESPRSANQLYCNYQCHLDSGGAYRAGLASVAAMQIYGAKKDANHSELVRCLKKLSVQVIDTSSLGGGFPDLICCVGHETLLVEIKNPNTGYGRRGLNKNQKIFAKSWTGGPIYIIKTIDDCVLLANLNMDQIYGYGGRDNLNIQHDRCPKCPEPLLEGSKYCYEHDLQFGVAS